MLSLPKLEAFLQNTNWPQAPERRPTFFSIARFPHYENVMSNVYQFFFQTDNPHGLGKLCTNALIDVVRSKRENLAWCDENITNVYALREVSAKDGQRLDILLHNGLNAEDWQSADVAILIENKVYHWLANNLSDYWSSITSETLRNEQKIGVVMGLRPEKLPLPWLYVTHLEWAEAVETRLGAAIYRAEPRYTTLLLELIENIRTMTNADESFKELIGFFQRNRLYISRAETIRHDVFMRFPSIVKASLPHYETWANSGANREGWLVIFKPGPQQFKYILGYYEVFHEDYVTPTYAITLVGEHESDKQGLRHTIMATNHAQIHGIQADTNAPHHVVSKIYSLTPADYNNLPKLIAENLRNDWQPLEHYWVASTEAL